MINGKWPIHPDLCELMTMSTSDLDDQLRVALPGTILSYDKDTRTAEIMPGFNRIYVDGKVVPMTNLVNVPVLMLRGGMATGVHVGLPVSAGDECLVIFADRDIDAWFENGDVQTPGTARKHDLSDGFAIVGFNSKAGLQGFTTPLTGNEGGFAQTGGQAKLGLDPDTGLLVAENGSDKLLKILQDLTTKLTTLATSIGSFTCTSPGSPVNGAVAASAAAIADLNAIAARLPLLLKG